MKPSIPCLYNLNYKTFHDANKSPTLHPKITPLTRLGCKDNVQCSFLIPSDPPPKGGNSPWVTRLFIFWWIRYSCVLQILRGQWLQHQFWFANHLMLITCFHPYPRRSGLVGRPAIDIMRTSTWSLAGVSIYLWWKLWYIFLIIMILYHGVQPIIID